MNIPVSGLEIHTLILPTYSKYFCQPKHMITCHKLAVFFTIFNLRDPVLHSVNTNFSPIFISLRKHPHLHHNVKRMWIKYLPVSSIYINIAPYATISSACVNQCQIRGLVYSYWRFHKDMFYYSLYYSGGYWQSSNEKTAAVQSMYQYSLQPW